MKLITQWIEFHDREMVVFMNVVRFMQLLKHRIRERDSFGHLNNKAIDWFLYFIITCDNEIYADSTYINNWEEMKYL